MRTINTMLSISSMSFCTRVNMASRVKPLYWREAASLIVMAPNGQAALASHQSDFDLLMVKRGGKSSFMANTYVFPGGVAGDGDFDSVGWTNKVFRNIIGYRGIRAMRDDLHIPGSRPPMMVKNEDVDIILPPEIVFRICAIRETFEETGILLVCRQSAVDLSRPMERGDGKIPDMHTMPNDFDAKQWRERVAKNEDEFQNLCVDFNVVPNIWALYEWTNWLTPVFNRVTTPPKKPKRFDTMFFTCCLKQMPPETKLYTDEISNAEWKMVSEWFRLGDSKEIKMVDVQMTEVSRLSQYDVMQELENYLRGRELRGSIRWFPIGCLCSDGNVLFLFPGDELYPETPDYEGLCDTLTTNETRQESCLRAQKLNRGLLGSWIFIINIDMPCGHWTYKKAHKSYTEIQSAL